MDSQLAFVCASVIAMAVGAYIFWGPSSTNRRRRGCIKGLVNSGNTCFINALLQALASCQFFIRWLEDEPQEAGGLAAALFTSCKVLNGIEPVEEDCYKSTSVVRALHHHRWIISPGQNDCHELFLVIMSTLKEEIQKNTAVISMIDVLRNPTEMRFRRIICVSKHNITPDATGLEYPAGTDSPVSGCVTQHLKVPSPFQGYLTTQLKCTSCKYKSPLLYDQFDSLSLTLPNPGEIPSRPILFRLLDDYTAAEIIKGFTCESCSQGQDGSKPSLRTAVKTLSFGKLPKCLCFHIQRTTWQATGMAIKRDEQVEFPEFISMDPFTSAQLPRRQSLAEVYRLGPRVGAATSRIKHLYRLVAVIVHTGGLHNGHFVTYRRVPSREHSWVYTSDQEVRSCTLAEVMSVCAYMLFYSKFPQNRTVTGTNSCV